MTTTLTIAIFIALCPTILAAYAGYENFIRPWYEHKKKQTLTEKMQAQESVLKLLNRLEAQQDSVRIAQHLTERNLIQADSNLQAIEITNSLLHECQNQLINSISNN